MEQKGNSLGSYPRGCGVDPRSRHSPEGRAVSFEDAAARHPPRGDLRLSEGWSRVGRTRPGEPDPRGYGSGTRVVQKLHGAEDPWLTKSYPKVDWI